MKAPFLRVLILLGALFGSSVAWAQAPEQVPGQAIIENAQGSYIFVFDPAQVDRNDIPGLAQALVQEHGAGLRHTFSHALQGFSPIFQLRARHGWPKTLLSFNIMSRTA